jgi:hypothetical protein
MPALKPQQPDSALLRAALWFARELKFYVFPVFEPIGDACSCGDAACSSPAKHPRTEHGLKDATTDAKQLSHWWERWPNASIGIACGPSRLLIIDHDVRTTYLAGHAELAEYVGRTHGPLPETCVVLTGAGDGSTHDYLRYSWTDGDRAPSGLEPGIDLKGRGGYVIAPPSRHISGRGYQVDGISGAQEFLKIAPAPEWLVKFIQNGSRQQQNRAPDTEEKWTEGSRNNTLFRLACSMRRQGMTVEEITTVLQSANRVHCQPPLADSEVAGIAQSSGRYARGEERTAHPANEGGPPAEAGPQRVIPWPDPLESDALYGLAGELVEMIGPRSEADPVALLLHLLVSLGNLIGRGPHFRVGGAEHHAVLYNVTVGPTASGKGQAKEDTGYCLQQLDAEWFDKRVKTGLSSGEGFIWHVRDPIEEQHAIKEKNRVIGYEMVVTDKGEEDKRLLVTEPEFASALRVMDREGNTLSAQLRQAWDHGNVGTLTKHKAAKARGVHASLLGHITREELLRYFSCTEQANGFGNRILWTCVHRSQLLPEGGRLEEMDWSGILERLRQAVLFARSVGEVRRSPEAREIWHSVYGDLRAERTGMFGAVTGRAAPQVMRLALIYALLDRSDAIEAAHLIAALAVWTYCEQSARFLFGEIVGNDIADDLLRALRMRSEGMTRTDVHLHFGKNKTAGQIDQALVMLQERGLVRMVKSHESGATKMTERWFAT